MSKVIAAAAQLRPTRSRTVTNSGHVAMASTTDQASAGRKVASIHTASASRPSAAATPAPRRARAARFGIGISAGPHFGHSMGL